MNVLTLIFLIHGLGGSPASLRPLEAYLEYQGYKNVHRITYPSQTVSLEKSIEHVSHEMLKIAGSLHRPVVVIGQSLGGVVCHELGMMYGWNIKKSITIGSPHHRSSFLRFVQSIVPNKITEYIHKPVYDDLLVQTTRIPVHRYYTISTSFFPCFSFDGQVWIDETKISDDVHHHIPFNNHWTLFIDPRMFSKVKELIEN